MDSSTRAWDLSAFSETQNAALDELMKFPERKQLEIWRTLKTPTINDLYGEYIGLKTLVDYDVEGWRRLQESFWNPQGHMGYWIGKGFRPTGDAAGEGYNCWSRLGGRIRRVHQFATCVAPSLVDQKPSFHLQYSAFKNQAADIDLVDELRSYGHELFIGVATRRAPDGGRTPPTVFVMAGPGQAWRGVDDRRIES